MTAAMVQVMQQELMRVCLDQESITWNDHAYMWWHPDDGYMIENFSELDEQLVKAPSMTSKERA